MRAEIFSMTVVEKFTLFIVSRQNRTHTHSHAAHYVNKAETTTGMLLQSITHSKQMTVITEEESPRGHNCALYYTVISERLPKCSKKFHKRRELVRTFFV